MNESRLVVSQDGLFAHSPRGNLRPHPGLEVAHQATVRGGVPPFLLEYGYFDDRAGAAELRGEPPRPSEDPGEVEAAGQEVE